MRRDVERLVAELGLENHVQITGWTNEEGVRDEVFRSRALVLPSFAEGLPLAIIEALALHRPVISTYIAGIPELVRHGINGWLIPAGSVQDLVEAMREALSAPTSLLEQMGQAGTSRVAELHEMTSQVRKLADLIIGPALSEEKQGDV